MCQPPPPPAALHWKEGKRETSWLFDRVSAIFHSPHPRNSMRVQLLLSDSECESLDFSSRPDTLEHESDAVSIIHHKCVNYREGKRPTYCVVRVYVIK